MRSPHRTPRGRMLRAWAACLTATGPSWWDALTSRQRIQQHTAAAWEGLSIGVLLICAVHCWGQAGGSGYCLRRLRAGGSFGALASPGRPTHHPTSEKFPEAKNEIY